MSGGIEQLVVSGPLLLAMPIAAAAGAVTFLSPCVLPLVPGYLSYVTGMSGVAAASSAAAEETAARSALAGADTAQAASSVALGAAGYEAGRAGGTGTLSADVGRPPSPATAGGAAQAYGRGRVVLGTALFVLGFSVLFALYGVAFGSVGSTLKSHEDLVSRVLGCLIIVMGLLFAGVLDRFTFAGRIFRPSMRLRAGLAGAPLLGVMFGLGWPPCIGPTLAAVLTLSYTTGSADRGALLAFIYGLGIGIPFMIVAVAFQRGMNLFGFAKRHAQLITRVGGIMLIVVGVLEVTGTWGSAVSWVQAHWISGYTPPL